jgi:hypothetical protein
MFPPSLNPRQLNRPSTTPPLLLCALLLVGFVAMTPAGADPGIDAPAMSQPSIGPTPITSLIPEADELPTFTVFQTPEPSRVILLVIGTLMVLGCYRRAWVNFKRQ